MSVVEHAYTREDIHFKTTAKKVVDDWFAWRIELAEPADKLKKIKEVEYILHPSFPQRFHRSTDRESKFALESEGWGDFDIVANVFFEDGEEKTVLVPLKLS